MVLMIFADSHLCSFLLYIVIVTMEEFISKDELLNKIIWFNESSEGQEEGFAVCCEIIELNQ